MSIDFRELLRKASQQFPSQQAFAEALRISTPRLNRALNKGDYPLNVLNCLRLADISGESPSEILRAAGKTEVADLIERLYGRENNAGTAASDRAVLNAWHGITDERSRDAMLFTLRRLATGAGPPDAGSGERGATRGGSGAAARKARSGRTRSRE